MKDQKQAEQVFSVLLEDRPADITLAYDAARKQGDSFVKSFNDGLNLLDEEIAAAVRDQLAAHVV